MERALEKIISTQNYINTHEKNLNRLLKFLNNIYSKSATPNEWRNAIVIPVFKKVTNEIPKTVEELVY
jgi:hypothetical protein